MSSCYRDAFSTIDCAWSESFQSSDRSTQKLKSSWHCITKYLFRWVESYDKQAGLRFSRLYLLAELGPETSRWRHILHSKLEPCKCKRQVFKKSRDHESSVAIFDNIIPCAIRTETIYVHLKYANSNENCICSLFSS